MDLIRRKTKLGGAQAALLSAMIGCLTLAIVNLGTAISPDFNKWIHSVGKLWIPGAEGIGPYSGKETLMLIFWLLSWFTLGRVLKNREWNMTFILVLFLIGMGIATTLLWPPVFELFGAH